MENIKEYEFMDCMGDWLKNENKDYFNLNKNIYYSEDEEIYIKSWEEIYSDIIPDGKAYFYYWIRLHDETELFIRVTSNSKME